MRLPAPESFEIGARLAQPQQVDYSTSVRLHIRSRLSSSRALRLSQPRAVLVLAQCFVFILGVIFGQFSAAAATGPDAFGYSAATTGAFTFTNITSGSRVLVLSDDNTVTVNLGFTFNFYGSNYSSVSFSPNGLMTFGGASSDFNNVNLSTTVAPSNNLPCIAVLWDDWYTIQTGADAVYYRTIGSPGARQFIVQWNRLVAINGSGVDPVTFEARLFESSNSILFSYLDTVVSDDPSYANGAFATVGIRDRDGQLNGRNLLWSHNQAVINNGLNILFTRPNQPPFAGPDSATILEDTPRIINVLTNDSDADGNPLIITAVTPATNGVVTINGGTNLTYRPNQNFNGLDGFRYTVSDGQGGFATGAVSVVVTPVNDPPYAAPDVLDTEFNFPLVFSAAALLTNDLDADGDLLMILDVSTTGSAGGTVNYTNNTIAYTPPPGFTGTEVFDYTLGDGHGAAATGLVTIHVWPPVQATAISKLGESIAIIFSGLPLHNYQIQCSTNLYVWSTLTNRSADDAGNIHFLDSSAAHEPQKFFRARPSW